MEQRPTTPGDEMAARAAWLYYAGGHTQSAIAKQFGIPTTKAHRLIAKASREGLVRVFVDARVESCLRLEQVLAERFGLRFCQVAPDIGEGTAFPLRTLGMAGAAYLKSIVEGGAHGLIGIGHGRTLAASVDLMPETPAVGVQFVSLLGGLTRKYAANPFDVIHRLADKAQADAFMMPAPLFANTVADKNVILAQHGMAQIMALIEQASLYLIGIGAIDADGALGAAAVIEEPQDLEQLRRLGARAEILGQFVDADGKIVSTRFDGRAMAPALHSLAGKEVIAIAGGETKTEAIRAALRSGIITGMITEEATARRLAAI
ncbi:MAG: sugar-binding transcriptional regulator [Geminicoccaceae bacterium]